MGIKHVLKKRLSNKWTNGKVNFQIPPLPTEYRRASGAFFQSFTFEETVSEETALIIIDDPQFSRELGILNPFELWATPGMARTSLGSIAYIIWVVSSRHGHIVDYEHFLNPFEMGTIRLLSGVAQQTHLKVLIVDSYNSEVVGFVEFENNFDLGKFATVISQVVGTEPVADFAQTQEAVRKEFSLEVLKGLSL